MASQLLGETVFLGGGSGGKTASNWARLIGAPGAPKGEGEKGDGGVCGLTGGGCLGIRSGVGWELGGLSRVASAELDWCGPHGWNSTTWLSV